MSFLRNAAFLARLLCALSVEDVVRLNTAVQEELRTRKIL